MKTTSCNLIRRLRPSGRLGVVLVGVVLAAYLGLATHLALHSSLVGETECVFCVHGDQHGVAPEVAFCVADIASDVETHAPVWQPYDLAIRPRARGPPLHT